MMNAEISESRLRRIQFAKPVVNSTEVASLTGVRGVCAAIVVFYHFGMTELDHAHDVWSLPHGYLAVDLFFILSGYVIARGYKDAFLDHPFSAYIPFLIRRVARVYPAYAAIGALYFLRLAFHLHGDETLARFHLHDIAGNVLMLVGWGLHIYPLNGVSWAVSAEFGSYFLFPLLLAVTFYRRMSWLVPAVGAMFAIHAVGTSGLGYHGALDVVDVRSVLPLVRAIAGFTFGVVIFRCVGVLERVPEPLQDCLLAANLLAIVAVSRWADNDFAIYAFFIPLVALMSREGPLARVLFGNRLAHHLGVISYSIYLIHPLFVGPAAILSRHFGATLFAYVLSSGFFLGLTWGLAWLSYLFVEVPGRHYIVRMLAPQRATRTLRTTG